MPWQGVCPKPQNEIKSFISSCSGRTTFCTEYHTDSLKETSKTPIKSLGKIHQAAVCASKMQWEGPDNTAAYLYLKEKFLQDLCFAFNSTLPLPSSSLMTAQVVKILLAQTENRESLYNSVQSSEEKSHWTPRHYANSSSTNSEKLVY